MKVRGLWTTTKRIRKVVSRGWICSYQVLVSGKRGGGAGAGRGARVRSSILGRMMRGVTA